MEETCKGCGKWEEDIYWTHFQNIHFSQFLHDDFNQHLEIPKKFVNNLKTKMPETVSLKGPSGVSWNVGLMTNNDTLFFKHGWPEFVKDHSLKENDFLIFRYNRESCFDVLMFDGESLCEKEVSYFVRKCVTGKEVKECRSEKHEIGHVNKGHDSSLDVVGGTMLERSTSADSSYMPSQQRVISPSSTRTKKMKRGWINLSLRSNEPSSARGAMTKQGIKHTSISRNRINYRVQYVSNRRPVTEEEKKNALQLALTASTDESCTVVMRPTQVYKGFYVTVPYKWSSEYLSMQNRNMILRVKENTWPARYYCNETREIGRFTSGWKNFAVENYLEEFDVCLFVPAGHMNSTIIMDVSIFRVVQEVIPPTLVNSSTSRLPLRCGRASKKARN